MPYDHATPCMQQIRLPKGYIMEPKMIAEQIFNFQKSLLLNARATTDALQEYGEKMTKVFMEPMPHLPNEAKSLVDTWMEAFKKGQKDLETLQDKSLDNLRTYVLKNS